MDTFSSAVDQYFLILATSILKGIGEDCHRGEIARIVHLLGEGKRCRGGPGGIKGDGVQGVANNITKHRDLNHSLPDPFFKLCHCGCFSIPIYDICCCILCFFCSQKRLCTFIT